MLAQVYRLEISKNNKKINNSSFFPIVGVSAQYGYTQNESNTSLILNQSNLGFTGNLNLHGQFLMVFQKKSFSKMQKLKLKIMS